MYIYSLIERRQWPVCSVCNVRKHAPQRVYFTTLEQVRRAMTKELQ